MMSTKSKEKVKEQRGTSHSISRQGDPTPGIRRPSPAATGKEVPNYLKSTSSSRLDSSSKPTIKKQSTTDKQSPQLTRRRSLDKPPSPSRVSKPQTSIPSPTSLRSLSFSSKTNASSKPQLEKSTKATKDVGKNSLIQKPRPSTVRKSTPTNTNNKKQNNAASGTTWTMKATKRSGTLNTTIDSSKLEKAKESDQESLPSEVEEMHEENILAAEVYKPEESKGDNNEDIINEEELDVGEEQLKFCDYSSPVIENQSADLSVDSEEINQGEIDQTPAIENDNDNIQKTNDHKKEECANDTLAGEQHEEVDGEKKEMGEELADASSKEEVEGTEKAIKDEEIQKDETFSKGLKAQEAETRVIQKSTQGASLGKKDTTAYNDVIEETASKLREQRKNKVKALVGAFETVISLESETTPE